MRSSLGFLDRLWTWLAHHFLAERSVFHRGRDLSKRFFVNPDFKLLDKDPRCLCSGLLFYLQTFITQQKVFIPYFV